jgi:DhnA family fructose-bisphosphate aldolase class Ia
MGWEWRMTTLDFQALRETRVKNPEAIAAAFAKRSRRSLSAGDGRLMVVAADHPARGALGVGADAAAMSNREELLTRLVRALSRPGVDGVLATPDIIDDLVLLGALEDKLVVGSMNRGGISGSTFEMDDRFGAYDIEGIVRDGLDFAKTLTRINLSDPGTANTLEATANAITDAAKARVPIMVEPFMSEWVDNKIRNILTAEAAILSMSISAGLGNSSAYTWLKIPVVDDMERVMASTTLPTLLLGGDHKGNFDDLMKQWAQALALEGVKGLVVGRTLLYPHTGDVESAIDAAVELVHG